MMNAVKVRELMIGEGMPVICASITGNSREEVLSQARLFETNGADIAEWRADWFEDVYDTEKVLDVAESLNRTLDDMPLLFTFRTAREGGERAMDAKAYVDLNTAVIQSGYVDVVDVELFTGTDEVSELIRTAHDSNVKVIASNHDFSKTPDKDEIVRRLCKMQDLGADIPKIAVMPNSKSDVLVLLSATEEMADKHADRPIITMSMAGTGMVSRLCGEVFGSALTFGAAAKASAPGQIAVGELRKTLEMIHAFL